MLTLLCAWKPATSEYEWGMQSTTLHPKARAPEVVLSPAHKEIAAWEATAVMPAPC